MEYSPRLLHQIRTDSNMLLSQIPWPFSICNVTSEKKVHFIKLYYLKLSIISHFFCDLFKIFQMLSSISWRRGNGNQDEIEHIIFKSSATFFRFFRFFHVFQLNKTSNENTLEKSLTYKTIEEKNEVPYNTISTRVTKKKNI